MQQRTESKKLAPAWWEEGKCLVTGLVNITPFVNNNKLRKNNKPDTNWN